MAFTKKQNRRLIIGEDTYVWHLKANYAWDIHSYIAVRNAQWPQGQLLLVDQLAPSYEFEVRPRMMREAILFALANGWNPNEKAPPIYLGFDNLRFFVLPNGIRRTYDFHQLPSVPRSQSANESLEAA